MKYSFVLISIFVLIHGSVFSQDTIKTVSGNSIIAKVVEINKSEIKYKKFSNLDGPVYIITPEEVHAIIYPSGEKDDFSSYEKQEIKTATKAENKTNDGDSFKTLTKNGNKVYISCDNDNAIIHATNALQTWGYWTVTRNRREADFILHFNIRFAGLGDAFGNAQFINPKNGQILKTTNEVNTIASWDVNTKRGVINRIVYKEIQPLFPR